MNGNCGGNFDDLPSSCSSAEPDFSWGEANGMAFGRALNRIYDEIVHWNRNLFLIPDRKLEIMYPTLSDACSSGEMEN